MLAILMRASAQQAVKTGCPNEISGRHADCLHDGVSSADHVPNMRVSFNVISGERAEQGEVNRRASASKQGARAPA